MKALSSIVLSAVVWASVPAPLYVGIILHEYLADVVCRQPVEYKSMVVEIWGKLVPHESTVGSRNDMVCVVSKCVRIAVDNVFVRWSRRCDRE